MKYNFYCFRCDKWFRAEQREGNNTSVICKDCNAGDHVVRGDHPILKIKQKLEGKK